MAAAQRLFAERAYEEVSTTDIATAAGTTRTNVHHHFRSKRDLFLEVIERFSRVPEGLDGPTRPVSTSRSREIEEMLSRWLDTIERNQRMFMTMLRASSSSDPQVSGALRQSMQAWELRLLSIAGMEPDDLSHRAMMRSFQAMVADATAAWLDTGCMSKAQVQALLSNCLEAVGRSVLVDDASADR